MGSDDRDVDSERDDAVDRRQHDLDALRLTHEEARALLDQQIETANDVDDKAAKTSRLAVLLLGLLFTAGTFFARTDAFDAAPYFNAITAVGAFLLVLSFVFAVATYTTTQMESGVGPTDLHRLVRDRYSEEEWLILLLRSEAAWIEANERRLYTNGTLLTTSHVTLIAAISCIVAGASVVHW